MANPYAVRNFGQMMTHVVPSRPAVTTSTPFGPNPFDRLIQAPPSRSVPQAPVIPMRSTPIPSAVKPMAPPVRTPPRSLLPPPVRMLGPARPLSPPMTPMVTFVGRAPRLPGFRKAMPPAIPALVSPRVPAPLVPTACPPDMPRVPAMPPRQMAPPARSFQPRTPPARTVPCVDVPVPDAVMPPFRGPKRRVGSTFRAHTGLHGLGAAKDCPKSGSWEAWCDCMFDKGSSAHTACHQSIIQQGPIKLCAPWDTTCLSIYGVARNVVNALTQGMAQAGAGALPGGGDAGEDEQKGDKEFPWTAVGIGAGVLAAGGLVYLGLRRKKAA